jgi:bile acid:Na+ symporter, BASS family
MGDSLAVLDQVRLNFNSDGLFLLNLTLAIIMFGVALEIKTDHFVKLLRQPKAALVGIGSQFILLPFVTFLLVLLIKPTATVALGMILVASCPGGNISNFISVLAKGNAALSVSLTAFSTLAAIFLTPLNFFFWGGLYNATTPAFQPIEIDSFSMFQTVFIILGLPLAAGMYFSVRYPVFTRKIIKPLRYTSVIIFLGYILIALAMNFTHFSRYIHLILIIVLIHNALALITGYTTASIFKITSANRRTISIETGIQNSGLALVLIFNPKIFPAHLEIGGMAIIAAWWGIWHIISGLLLALFWSRRINQSELAV